MTSTSRSRRKIEYSHPTRLRAERALRCSPFTPQLMRKMVEQSVPLPEIAGPGGQDRGYTRQLLTELTAENELLWLIQVGLLRREVDGQGLTDSFRVTPLGRQLIQDWQLDGAIRDCPPTWSDRLYNACNRWFRLPVF
ncbi:MAG: Npun_F0494 family protein [Leptolyngbyaceae cyanobacterium]